MPQEKNILWRDPLPLLNVCLFERKVASPNVGRFSQFSQEIPSSAAECLLVWEERDAQLWDQMWPGPAVLQMLRPKYELAASFARARNSLVEKKRQVKTTFTFIWSSKLKHDITKITTHHWIQQQVMPRWGLWSQLYFWPTSSLGDSSHPQFLSLFWLVLHHFNFCLISSLLSSGFYHNTHQ